MKHFRDFNLKLYNSYRLEAKASAAFFPESEEDIVKLYKASRDYILLGSGHNVILSKKFYETPFIIFKDNFNKITWFEDGVAEVESGVFTSDLALSALEKSYSGVEVFFDIPSSIGGAVVMNAGASGEEIKDLVIKVRYLDLADMQVKEIFNEDIGFGYRNSFFHQNADKIVIKVWLQLDRKEKHLIKEKMDFIKAQRWEKQPKEFPNAGSVFKRPQGHYVGAIMDQLNLKGLTVGGAKISEKHGGFIVNFKNATGADIIGVINEVKRRVFDELGVALEVEQRVL